MSGVPQEDVEYENGQKTAEKRGLFHLVDGPLDELGLVGQDVQLDALGQRIGDVAGHLLQCDELPYLCSAVTGLGLLDLAGLEPVDVGQLLGSSEKPVSHALCSGNDVCVGLFEDLDLNALDPVHARDDLALFVAAQDVAHVFQPDLNAVLLPDHQVLDLLDGLEFVQGPDQVLRLAVQQASAGKIDVLFPEPVVDGVYAQTHLRKLVLADLHTDLFFESALHACSCHPLQCLQLLLHLFLSQQTKRVEVCVPIDAHTHDGILRRVIAQDEGPVHALGKPLAIEVFANGLHRGVHIRVPPELKDNVGHARPGDGDDAHQVVHHAELLLDGTGDEILDFLRRGVGVLRANGEGGVGDVGHEGERQLLVGYVPENRDCQYDHENGDRPPCGNFEGP